MRRAIRAWLIRLLGMKHCGRFGGYSGTLGSPQLRWCFKPFGHSDSCAFDQQNINPALQPNESLRRYFRGWDD